MITPDIFETSSSLHIAAADYFLNSYKKAIQHHNAFHVALSGGTTPKFLYQLLAKPPYKTEINWSNVFIYFGDERFVPNTHNDSNYKMASQTLLLNVPLATDHILSVDTSLNTARLSAEDYHTRLTNQLPIDNQGNQQFDLVLLGLGPDGHTASLFPDTAILQQTETLCDAVYVEKFDSWRISLTYPAINTAAHILLLSEGAGKADIIHELVNAPEADNKYPVQAIKPKHVMHWFIDKAAATRL